MVSAKKCFGAYGQRIEKVEQTKLPSELEVRCVMHVYQMKASSRQDVGSLREIAEMFHNSAKKIDELLPVWSKLEAA